MGNRRSSGTTPRIAGRTAVAVAAVAAATAFAADVGSASTITGAAGVYPCVSTSAYCGSIGQFGAGTTVSMRCWIDGRSATGAYTSNRWFLVRRGTDGYEGFVHSSRVGAQSVVGWCGDSVRVRAGLRAAERLGQITPTDPDVRDGGWTRYGTALSAFGVHGDWSGDCAKLAWISFFRAGRQLVRSSAAEMFTYHWNRPAERGSGALPRYGALVGFGATTSNPYGHVAVAIGGTRIASSQGGENARLPNERLATTTAGYGPYRGWVTIP